MLACILCGVICGDEILAIFEEVPISDCEPTLELFATEDPLPTPAALEEDDEEDEEELNILDGFPEL